MKSIRREGVAHKLILKSKGSYILPEKGTLGLQCLKSFPFCEGLKISREQMKESTSRIEKIPFTMVLHNHLVGAETRFYNIAGPMVTNYLVKWLRIIRIWAYKEAAGDSRQEYDSVQYFWTYEDSYSDSSGDDSIQEVGGYYENQYEQCKQ